MTEPIYDPSAFPPVFVTVDIVVFTLIDDLATDPGQPRRQLGVVLIRRGEAPFAGAWALPGGFIHQDEDLETAALRELAEEVGVHFEPGRLHQIGAYGSPDRDPRSRVVSVGYVALVHDLPELAAGSDAHHAELIPIDAIDATAETVAPSLELAFDHRLIVDDALEYVQRLIEETDAALDFCDEEFTINDLRAVYEAVWRRPIERTGFQKKVRAIEGFIEPTVVRRIVASSEPTADSTAESVGKRPDAMDAAPLRSMALSSMSGSTSGTPVVFAKGRPPQFFARGTVTELDPPLRRPKSRKRRSTR